MGSQEHFTYRPLDKNDERRIDEWVKADPEHATGDPGFFYEPRPGTAHLAMEQDGKPVFYATVENVARVHIQFNPQGNKLQTAKAIIAGFRWLLANLKQRGYAEVIFDSRFPSLIKFAQKCLGFTKREQDYSARL